MYIRDFEPDKMLSKLIQFSSATTPRMLQESVEGELVKKNAKTYQPDRGL
jgi:hypothetical protein